MSFKKISEESIVCSMFICIVVIGILLVSFQDLKSRGMTLSDYRDDSNIELSNLNFND
ncbi:MAG: hypothetical protein ACK5NF_04370 [Bacilli bacterium]